MFFQNSIGIDIKNDGVAFVLAQRTVKGIKVVAHDFYSLESTDTRERLKIVSRLTETFIKTYRASTATIYLSVPEQLCLFKEIVFPPAVKENLRSTLKYEMEKFIPVPVHELHFDYQIVSEDRNTNQLNVLLSAVKKKDAAAYIDFAGELSKPVSGLESASTARANTYAYLASVENRKQNIDISSFLKDPASAGINDVDVARLGLTSPELLPAFGLALKGLRDVELKINLLPELLRKKPSKIGYYLLVVLLVTGIMSAVAWTGGHFVRKQMIVSSLDAEIERYKADVREVVKIQSRLDETESRIDYLNTLQKKATPVLDVLAELTRLIPKSTWINDFYISENSIQIRGSAESASDLVPLIEGSPMFKDTVFLSTITKSRDGMEQFHMGFKIE